MQLHATLQQNREWGGFAHSASQRRNIDGAAAVHAPSVAVREGEEVGEWEDATEEGEEGVGGGGRREEGVRNDERAAAAAAAAATAAAAAAAEPALATQSLTGLFIVQ